MTLDETTDFIGARRLHDQGITGKGVKICVIDTGAPVQGPAKDRLKDYASTVPGSSGQDDNGHGTAVSNTAIAVAPDADLYAVKALDHNGAGTFTQILDAVELAVQRWKPHVVNMSLGTPFAAYLPEYERLFWAMRHLLGIIPVVAAGNSGPALGTVGAPGTSESAVTVGAVTVKVPAPGYVAAFSSRGPTPRGRIKPDVVAPGGGMREGILLPLLEGEKPIRGTSFATPHVAGAVALLRQKFPKDTADNIVARLYAATIDIVVWGKDVWSGYGIIRVDIAASYEKPPSKPGIIRSLAFTTAMAAPAAAIPAAIAASAGTAVKKIRESAKKYAPVAKEYAKKYAPVVAEAALTAALA